MKQKLLPLAVFALASCGTLFTPKLQKVSFDSNEAEVSIYIDGQKICQTPCLTKIDRGSDTLLIVAKKDGFEDQVINLNPSVNLVSLLNIFSTTGFSTDASCGYLWEYRPNAFYVTVEKEPKMESERKQREKEHAIRKYILSNFSDIATDVTGEDGEYLKNLSVMTGISEASIIGEMRKHPDETSFVNRIIAIFRE